MILGLELVILGLDFLVLGLELVVFGLKEGVFGLEGVELVLGELLVGELLLEGMNFGGKGLLMLVEGVFMGLLEGVELL
jgi:hypothetical protein